MLLGRPLKILSILPILTLHSEKRTKHPLLRPTPFYRTSKLTSHLLRSRKHLKGKLQNQQCTVVLWGWVPLSAIPTRTVMATTNSSSGITAQI